MCGGLGESVGDKKPTVGWVIVFKLGLTLVMWRPRL